MSLDISYYERIVFDRPSTDEYDGYDDGLVCLYPCPDDPEFSSRADGIQDGWFKPEGETGDFRAGSYGGYNAWRNQLCQMAHGVDSEVFWSDSKYRGTAFYELINFADNEGCIGPRTSAKLASDFMANQAKAEAFAASDAMAIEGDWFLKKYNEWRKAFEVAAKGGAVQLH